MTRKTNGENAVDSRLAARCNNLRPTPVFKHIAPTVRRGTRNPLRAGKSWDREGGLNDVFDFKHLLSYNVKINNYQ